MARNPITGPATEGELIEREIAASLSAFEQHLRIIIANGVSGCESPIERVLMAAMIARAEVIPGEKAMFYIKARRFDDIRHAFDGLHVYPQVSVDGYRLDFLAFDVFQGEVVRHTVIEVDGHDFHERTRKQASHDKKRDRHFTSKGWQVVRFTGGDVWANPSECAREALEIALGAGC